MSSSSHKKMRNAQKLVKSIKQLLKSLDGSSSMTTEAMNELINNSSSRFNPYKDLDREMKRLDNIRGRSSETLNALDAQIRDAVHSFEDVLDSQLSAEFLSLHKSRRRRKQLLSLDLDTDQVWQGIKTFAKTVKKLEEEYVRELDNMIISREEEVAPSYVYTDFGVETVGFSRNLVEIKEQVERKVRPSEFGVFSILGVKGTGRTAAARASFEYLLLSEENSGKYLDCGAWVTVGANYELREILVNIIDQIDENFDYLDQDTEKLGGSLYACLKGRRFLIVLDDVRDEQIWDELRSSFPEEDNGSLVMITTGVKEVAISANSLHVFEMTVYDEKESWGILEQAIFGGNSCPLEMEEAGKKIAKNCGGCRLALAKVIVLLLKGERKLEFWNRLAEDAGNPIFVVDDELSEILEIENDNLQLPKSFSGDQREATAVVTDMVALSGFKEAIEEEVFPTTCFPKMGIIYILGMAGIGKTRLAKQFFEDPEILGQFDNHVWLTLGPKYKSENIVQDILAQISSDIHVVSIEIYPVLAERWLIVLDDVWDNGIFYHLQVSFPDIRGKVLVTTRQIGIIYDYSGMPNQLQLLNEEESWSLLCQKVFGNGSCPPELEEDGKKIAKNCEGLPLLILTVAVSLSKAENLTPECWKIVAKNKENSLFLDAYEEISKVLYPSYEYLPQQLKACFLYTGAFPQNYEIPTSKLIKLFSVEGFLEQDPDQKVEKVALSCVHKLSDQNLVMFCEEGSGANAKSYTLHSSFWYLSNSIAEKSKFLFVLDCLVNDDSIECMKNQRRLCIRNSIVLIIRDVYNAMESLSSARSLLCFGPSSQYPVPICLGLRLLRVVDALTIRFYEFPVDVLELIHLRYLALTCDGSLPSHISKLWFLQFLIINHYHNIRSSRNSLHLPVEIWDMKELKHLQVAGSILLDPNSESTSLPNLITLLDVSVHSCTEKILSRMPNLKKLGVQIELSPRDGGETFDSLNLKSVLRRLMSLKYVVMNPELIRPEVALAPSIPIPMFSSSLKKLKLGGFGYPWEYMSIIGKLQNLKVLKLQCYAFRGPKWDTNNDGFRKLEFLSIEDSDVVEWNVKRSSFPELRYVIIKDCYKLKELPYHLSNSMVLIEVIDSNPSVGKWAKQMEEKETKNVIGSRTIGIEVHSSWEK
ncbi:hypothetical protein C2S52_005210 [Perilla frutescens var. hirtella]|nr:hypothetical protein C2S52_005210 [Perilla frutescens var. hirtella]